MWQEESFDHVVRGDEGFSEKVEYIRQNPVQCGLVKKPEDYRWLWGGVRIRIRIRIRIKININIKIKIVSVRSRPY